LTAQAAVQAYHGQFRSARQLEERAEALAANEGEPVPYAFFLELEEATAGYVNRPRLAARASNGQAQVVQTRAALILAQTGDLDGAQKLVDAVDHHAPRDSLVQNFYLPTIRAVLKLHMNDPAGAVEVLRRTAKYELSLGDAFNSLFPAYVRGLAYLR